MADERQNQQPQRPGQGGPGRPPGLKPGGPPGGLFVWVVFLFALLMVVYWVVQHQKQSKREQIHLSMFYQHLKEGQIADAEIHHNVVTGRYRGPFTADQFEEYSAPINDVEIENVSKALAEYNADPKHQQVDYSEDPSSDFMQMLIGMVPVLIIVVILWWLLARQFRSAGGTGSVLSFGKARAKLHTKEQSNVTFDQVAGIDEAKEEVAELVEFLKSPMKFRRLGGRIPRGVILIGPPGSGKTLLAKAIAGEAEVPFFSISGSDFVEMFVGVGASRVRDLFHQAKESSPCIIFLDEIDAVGRRRAIDIHGASAESAPDAQRDPRRDGRLRDRRQRHRHRRHQPPGRARSGAAPAGAIRPPDHRGPAGHPRARGDPEGACAEVQARRRRGPAPDRARARRRSPAPTSRRS